MLRVSIADQIATVVLSRPPVNAISGEWVGQFTAMLDDLSTRSDWKLLHLRSDQKVFCAGADLAEVLALSKACIAAAAEPGADGYRDELEGKRAAC